MGPVNDFHLITAYIKIKTVSNCLTRLGKQYFYLFPMYKSKSKQVPFNSKSFLKDIISSTLENTFIFRIKKKIKIYIKKI
jgi:hypothetical protein